MVRLGGVSDEGSNSTLELPPTDAGPASGRVDGRRSPQPPSLFVTYSYLINSLSAVCSL